MTEIEKAIQDVTKDKNNVSYLLDVIIQEAFYENASDVHIEPQEGNILLVRFRVDGILHDIITIKDNLEESLTFIIKVRAKLRTDLHYTPQDGKIVFELLQSVDLPDKCKIDARVSILPVTYGEKVVLRLLARENKSLTLKDLGFCKEDLVTIKKAYDAPYGLVLVSGPTGSGKTTTLYSVLKLVNSRKVNITTIEDPVEYSIAGVNHIQINPKANLTFASGLRSILRQDPNIIMVGEIRDTETARITINAALTGHLVLSTIHANDAITTIPRLLDMGIEPFLLTSTVNVIVAQRLARKLCSVCKKEFVLGENLIMQELLSYRPDIKKYLKESDVLYKPEGCEKCKGKGYKGRIGVFEVLRMSAGIREAIVTNKNDEEIQKIAQHDDFTPMLMDGIKKLKQGVIDIPELMKVIALKE